jgi:hypothetical protein
LSTTISGSIVLDSIIFSGGTTAHRPPPPPNGVAPFNCGSLESALRAVRAGVRSCYKP